MSWKSSVFFLSYSAAVKPSPACFIMASSRSSSLPNSVVRSDVWGEGGGGGGGNSKES